MFGKRLKSLREANNYSMEKLTELYNSAFDGKMNKSTLSRYENGLQEPMYTVVVNLAKLFNVSVDYLTCAENKPDNVELEEDVTQPQQSEFDILYNQLDSEDKAEVRGMIKGLLRADKYKKTNSIADDINNMMKAAENLGIKQK